VNFSGSKSAVKVARSSEITSIPSEHAKARLGKASAVSVRHRKSHDTFYKDEETFAELPEGLKLKRRINLMAGLIEVADQEFDRLNRDIPVYPALDIYKSLEQHYYKLSSKRPDKELSLEVIELLLPLYEKRNVNQVSDVIAEFVRDNEATLNAVYETAEEWNASAFLYQPGEEIPPGFLAMLAAMPNQEGAYDVENLPQGAEPQVKEQDPRLGDTLDDGNETAN
jgi:hypothetical protein